MVKTQVQLPDQLYKKAKAIAEQREWSLAEVVRRGIEYMIVAYPLKEGATDWGIPILSGSDFAPDFDKIDFKELVESEELSRR